MSTNSIGIRLLSKVNIISLVFLLLWQFLKTCNAFVIDLLKSNAVTGAWTGKNLRITHPTRYNKSYITGSVVISSSSVC